MKTFLNIVLSLLAFLLFFALFLFWAAAFLAGSVKCLVIAIICVPAIIGVTCLNSYISK